MTEEENSVQATNQKDDVSPSTEAQAFKEMADRLSSLEAENKSLRKAKKDYYDAVLNGGTIAEDSGPARRSKDEILKDFRNAVERKCTNLEYCTLALELDDACIDEDGESCFLPKGHDLNGNPIKPTMEERETAQNFHDALEECIDAAQGDPDAFNVEFARRLSETPRNRKR